MLGLAYEHLFPKPLACKTPKALKRYESDFKNAKKLWSTKMPTARIDLALACEGHINGYSFLTSDFEFFKLFRTLITNYIFSSPILKVSTLRKSLAVYYSTRREGGLMGN
ncbi:hypothetical protein TWF106_007157 [Orbilia oligospora]|uniref:Uncharacterized protein n=1 Tax=Orbilia oligospora TaxID=2813651 RepID=A0A7C8QQ55_ORBOL|nr:hypothetical protein TWF788_009848 [Orbilia oligospora]KAF3207831.1 hypothetical protein TWF679_008162 [Orbilia oligospora]KAF3219315.1 hypothetical protein TWF106_007157 [Orbilia oligospora]